MNVWRPFVMGVVGVFSGILLLVAVAWAADILRVDKDGTIRLVITDAGNVGIGTSSPEVTAILDIASTSKGLLLPRLTTAQRDAIASPATGLMVFNTTTNRLEKWTGAAWKPVSSTNIGARVNHNANQSISSGSFVALAFNIEQYDEGALHDTAVNNSRLTASVAGKYHVYGSVQWDSNATGSRALGITTNSGYFAAYDIMHTMTASLQDMSVSSIVNLGVGDYVQIQVFQNSGSSINILTESRTPIFGMTLMQE